MADDLTPDAFAPPERPGTIPGTPAPCPLPRDVVPCPACGRPGSAAVHAARVRHMGRLLDVLQRQQELQAQLLALHTHMAARQERREARQDDHARRLAQHEAVMAQLQCILVGVLELLCSQEQALERGTLPGTHTPRRGGDPMPDDTPTRVPFWEPLDLSMGREEKGVSQDTAVSSLHRSQLPRYTFFEQKTLPSGSTSLSSCSLITTSWWLRAVKRLARVKGVNVPRLRNAAGVMPVAGHPSVCLWSRVRFRPSLRRRAGWMPATSP